MTKTTESKEDLVQNENGDDENNESENEKDNFSETNDQILTPLEKKFLLCAERGDCATVRR